MTCAAVWGRVQISWTISWFHRRMLRNNSDERRRYHGKTCAISRRTSPVCVPPLQTCQGEEVRGQPALNGAQPYSSCGIWDLILGACRDGKCGVDISVLPLTVTWSRYCGLRVSAGLTHFSFYRRVGANDCREQ